MTLIESLEARVRRLEDADAIRRLKARYFTCCDRKDPEGMRDCFAPGPCRSTTAGSARSIHATRSSTSSRNSAAIRTSLRCTTA